MPSLLWTGFEVFINLVEVAGSVYLAWCLLGGDRKSYFFTSQSIVYIFVGTVWLSVYLFVDAVFYLDTLPVIITFILYSIFVLRAKWYFALLWSLVNMLLLLITAYTIPAILGAILNVPFGSFYEYESVRLLSMPLAHILWMGMLAITIRMAKPKQSFYQLKSSGWIFLSVPVFSIAFIAVLVQYAFALKDESVSVMFPALIGIGLMVINLGALYVYNQMSRQAEETMLLHAQVQLGSMAKHHQEELQELTSEMRRFRHDFNNHVHVLQGFAQTKNHAKLEAYLNDLADNVGSFSDYIVTGNTILDVLLSGNISLAKQKGIRVTLDAMVPEKLPISDQDLCILMGNLFNNALEANLKIHDTAKRFIDIALHVQNGQVVIMIKNATDGAEKKRGNRFVTTKNNLPGHGFGLVSIDHLVKTYGAFCEHSHHNYVFTTTLIFPMTALATA